MILTGSFTRPAALTRHDELDEARHLWRSPSSTASSVASPRRSASTRWMAWPRTPRSSCCAISWPSAAPDRPSPLHVVGSSARQCPRSPGPPRAVVKGTNIPIRPLSWHSADPAGIIGRAFSLYLGLCRLLGLIPSDNPTAASSRDFAPRGPHGCTSGGNGSSAVRSLGITSGGILSRSRVGSSRFPCQNAGWSYRVLLVWAPDTTPVTRNGPDHREPTCHAVASDLPPHPRR